MRDVAVVTTSFVLAVFLAAACESAKVGGLDGPDTGGGTALPGEPEKETCYVEPLERKALHPTTTLDETKAGAVLSHIAHYDWYYEEFAYSPWEENGEHPCPKGGSYRSKTEVRSDGSKVTRVELNHCCLNWNDETCPCFTGVLCTASRTPEPAEDVCSDTWWLVGELFEEGKDLCVSTLKREASWFRCNVWLTYQGTQFRQVTRVYSENEAPTEWTYSEDLFQPSAVGGSVNTFVHDKNRKWECDAEWTGGTTSSGCCFSKDPYRPNIKFCW